MSDQTATNPSYSITPIGRVRVKGHEFFLEIDPAYRAALQGLQGFGYIQVVWWFHLLDTPAHRKTVVAGQPYKNAPDNLGIFATRSPIRPNPIALTPVGVISLDIEQGLIQTPYIDAEDGTPILDIKPYQPCTDRVRDVQTPEWCASWPQWYEDSGDFDWSAVFNF